MTPEELESNLGQFTGTEEWHQFSGLFKRHLLTDGTKYLAENAGAYWLVEAIASHHHSVFSAAKRDPRLLDMQIWFLRVDKSKKAVLECWADTGEGEKCIIRQKIPFTDFPLNEIKLYVLTQPLDDTTNKFVIMLPSEY